jgi:hypothetical protein
MAPLRPPSLAMEVCLLVLRAACGLRSEVTSLWWQAMHGPDMLEAMPWDRDDWIADVRMSKNDYARNLLDEVIPHISVTSLFSPKITDGPRCGHDLDVDGRSNSRAPAGLFRCHWPRGLSVLKGGP